MSRFIISRGRESRETFAAASANGPSALRPGHLNELFLGRKAHVSSALLTDAEISTTLLQKISAWPVFSHLRKIMGRPD
jgi:hypothetical protein